MIVSLTPESNEQVSSHGSMRYQTPKSFHTGGIIFYLLVYFSGTIFIFLFCSLFTECTLLMVRMFLYVKYGLHTHTYITLQGESLYQISIKGRCSSSCLPALQIERGYAAIEAYRAARAGFFFGSSPASLSPRVA
jgi:hypothetical protein